MNRCVDTFISDRMDHRNLLVEALADEKAVTCPKRDMHSRPHLETEAQSKQGTGSGMQGNEARFLARIGGAPVLPCVRKRLTPSPLAVPSRTSSGLFSTSIQ